MKKNIYSLFLATCLIAITGCSSDSSEETTMEELSTSTPFLTFKSDGETLSFDLFSDCEWEITFDETSWCTIAPIKGSGDTEITVKAEKNKEEKKRNLSLLIKTETKKAIVNITQEAYEKEKTNFPLVTINTENNRPVDSKDYYLNATLKIESRNGDGSILETMLETDTEIKGRGNSTWGMEKKPYRLKFTKSSEVLGMPKNKHWVLLANYSDKTLMRNELAFEISRRMQFPYTPRAQHVDVMLNGSYIGNYMLCEHIRIDKNRVNIPELEPGDTDITGGYLLEIDERKGEPEWFETQEARMVFCINRPEDLPANQKAYISNHVQTLENVLYGKNGINTVTELPKYLDVKSFIDYLLLNEIAKNVDGNLRLSTFVYKNRQDDKIYFGPAWDYDIAFGNVDYDGCDKTEGWHARNAAWYQKFFSYETYRKMTSDRWKELRAGPLNDLEPFIDELAEKMEQSQKKNFEKWNILNKYVWPNAVVTGSYKGEINYLKDWLRKRVAWLDKELK